MLNRLFGGASLSALETMLTFASERQRVLAANIANVDTLGFRARDLSEGDFRRALDGAFRGRGPSAGFGAGETFDPSPLKPGGNNVDLELEMSRMVGNTVLHSTAAALLAQQFSLLREAVAGRVL